MNVPAAREAAWRCLLLVALVLHGCTGNGAGTQPDDPADDAAINAACDIAAQLADAPPWPPPTAFAIEDAVRSTGEPTLIAALEAALASQTDHERVVSPGYVGVAPSEAQEILRVCDDLRR